MSVMSAESSFSLSRPRTICLAFLSACRWRNCRRSAGISKPASCRPWRSSHSSPSVCVPDTAKRFYGASDLPNFYRKPYGPGWALVGDAGLHNYPFLALGICDALRDVEFLASAIGEGLAGKLPMLEALARYETRRNEASARDCEENLAAARFTPSPPELLAVRAAVRTRPEEATRLIKARQGMIDKDEFFNPQNLQRLLDREPSASM